MDKAALLKELEVKNLLISKTSMITDEDPLR